MSRFIESIPPQILRVRRACGIVSILVVLFMVVFYDSCPSRENNANSYYTQFQYQSNNELLNSIVFDASSVVGTQEWMRKKEIEMEARRTHVQEVCAKLNSKDRWRAKDIGRHIWFDMRHRFALCTHAKVWLINALMDLCIQIDIKILIDTTYKNFNNSTYRLFQTFGA